MRPTALHFEMPLARWWEPIGRSRRSRLGSVARPDCATSMSSPPRLTRRRLSTWIEQGYARQSVRERLAL